MKKIIFRFFLICIISLCSFAAVALASYGLVVVGDFSKEESEDLCKQLISEGYPAYMAYGADPEVRVGPYETREKAQEVLERLEDEDQVITSISDAEGYAIDDEVDDVVLSGRGLTEENSAKYQDERAKKIVSLAIDLFGHPYKYGGTRIGKGIDCSFFVQTIFKELGISLQRTARFQIKEGVAVQRANLKVGDLIFFKKTYFTKKGSYTKINHVGIYIGDGEFIHATINVNRVTISNLNEPYFSKRYAGARRVLTDK